MGPQTDHDLLIRIDENTKNIAASFNAHVESDASAFRSINKRAAWTEKVLYMGMGAIIVIQFFAPSIAKALGLG